MTQSDRIALPIRAAAALTMAIGGLALLGWILDLPALRSVLRGSVEMRANTAVGLILAGGAMLMLVRRPTRVTRCCVQAAALGVGAIGLATLGEYLLGWDLGIDQALFRDTVLADTAVPGRMSPYTAASFIACGLALAALSHPKLRILVWVLTVPVMLTGLGSLIGYLWDAKEIVTDALLPPVAINTAGGLMLIGGGILGATRMQTTAKSNRHIPEDNIRHKMLFGFVLAIAILILGFGLFYRSAGQFAAAEDRVDHTQQVLKHVSDLYANVSDAESSQRNYLITELPEYKEKSELAVEEARRQLQDLRRMTVDNPEQVQRVSDLDSLVRARMSLLQDATAVFEQVGFAAARRTVSSSEGLHIMEKIRGLTREMEAVEAALLAERQSAVEQERAKILLFLLLMLVGIGGIFTLLFYAIHRALVLRAEREEQIRSLNAQLDQFINLSHDMMCIASADGHFKRVNPAFTRVLGWSAEEFLGRPFIDFVHPEDHAATLREVERQIAAGESVTQFENRYRHKDGSWKVLSWASVPYEGTLMYATARDVTEVKRAEAEIRDREERLRAILDTVVDGIITIDDAGTVETFNPAASRIFGFEAGDVIGHNVKLLMPEPYRGEHDGYLENFLKTGNAKVIGTGREVVGRRKDGSTFPLELAVSEMRVGNKRMFTGIVRDITERKQSEQELIVSKNEAQRANRAKSAFLATMSHEIRTPLNGIIGNLELLALTQIDDAQVDLLDDANKAGLALLALIGNILDFSKIEEGKFVFETGDVDVAALTEEAVHVLQSRARQKGVFIVATYDPEVPLIVRADGPRIRQILLNLVGNAVKFTDKGGIHVHLGVTAWDKDVCELCFVIHDSGKGFHQSEAARLFEPFTQDKPHPTANEGSGLGLSICRSLVENFGGSIDGEGVPGEGASFTFTVPVVVVRPAQAIAPADLSGRSVLTVGGPSDRAERLRDYFTSRGAAVDAVVQVPHEFSCTAHTGGVERRSYDVVVFISDSVEGFSQECVQQWRDQRIVPLIKGPIPTSGNHRQSLRAGFAVLVPDHAPADYLDRNIRLIMGHAPSGAQRAVPSAVLLPEVEESLRDKRVLVLEDRLVNQTIIQKQLKLFGVVCSLASNGRKGLEAVRSEKFDLILCDCSMPEMNGFDFTRALRRMETEAGNDLRTPVIALTANAFREDAEECFEAGMDDFVSKPVTIDRLSTVLSKWLHSAPPSSEEPTARRANGSSGMPAIDIQVLSANIGTDDKATIDEILTQFVAAARDSLADVETSLGAGNPDGIVSAAHAAKGEAQSAAAMGLASRYEEMERQAKAGDLAELRRLAIRAAAELKRIEAFLGTGQEGAPT